MNTIPLTFDQREINRTIIGGSEKCPDIRMDASVLLINEGWNPNRGNVLSVLLSCGFKNVISVERNPDNYNIEDFSHLFPSVRFLLPLEPVTDGDLVNIAMSDIDTSYLLVVRDSLELKSGFISPTLFQNLTKDEPFCICPRLLLQGGVSFPIVFSPSSNKSVLSVNSSAKISDGLQNLYPYDGIALINRKKFISLGGYDYTIQSGYWQTLDLAFRSWLWGEKTVLASSFSINYGSDRRLEDTTANQHSNRFFLKNLAPIFVQDHAKIPLTSFPMFFFRSSCGIIEAWRQFKEARAWVFENKYRFRIDAVSLVEKWGV